MVSHVFEVKKIICATSREKTLQKSQNYEIKGRSFAINLIQKVKEADFQPVESQNSELKM